MYALDFQTERGSENMSILSWLLDFVKEKASVKAVASAENRAFIW